MCKCVCVCGGGGGGGGGLWRAVFELSFFSSPFSFEFKLFARAVFFSFFPGQVVTREIFPNSLDTI